VAPDLCWLEVTPFSYPYISLEPNVPSPSITFFFPSAEDHLHARTDPKNLYYQHFTILMVSRYIEERARRLGVGEQELYGPYSLYQASINLQHDSLHRLISMLKYPVHIMSNPTGPRTGSSRSRNQSQDPRQQLNERVQNHFGNTKKVLGVRCIKTVAIQHAQRWKCTFLLQGAPMGESNEVRNQRIARKEAAQKALQWMDEQGLH